MNPGEPSLPICCWHAFFFSKGGICNMEQLSACVVVTQKGLFSRSPSICPGLGTPALVFNSPPPKRWGHAQIWKIAAYVTIKIGERGLCKSVLKILRVSAFKLYFCSSFLINKNPPTPLFFIFCHKDLWIPCIVVTYIFPQPKILIVFYFFWNEAMAF